MPRIFLLNIKDFRINLYQCKNTHKSDNILLDEFYNTQMINEAKIKCSNCNNNKKITYNNQIFICLTCQQNLCPLCKSNHDKIRKIIDYDKKIIYAIFIMIHIYLIAKNEKLIYVCYAKKNIIKIILLKIIKI